ncbi:MAG: nitrous oxide reductase family maturation protein NosD, partial [Candidatus Thorarchaeota archaeon]
SCILMIIVLFFIPSILNNGKLNVKSDDLSQINSEIRDLHVSKIYGKIYINNNWSDAKAVGICTGSGNYSDPYVIEDLVIDAGGLGSCIWIVNSSAFFKIENCTLYNSRQATLPPWPMQAGIVLENASNGWITQNNISYNDLGILVEGENITISANIISKNIWGIGVGWSSYISENNISKNMIGIIGGGGVISLNNINNNIIGIYKPEYSSYSTIIENTINNNEKAGILLETSFNNIISKNEVSNNKLHGIWITMRTYWWDPDPYPFPGYNLITENSIKNNSYGINLNYTTDNSIFNNTVNNNEVSGVELHISYSNTISYNNLTGNYHGIKCNESRLNQINENMISNNYYGVSLISSDKNNIVQNSINYNHYGISFTSSIRNEIISNVLHYNWMCFIEDQDSYYNNFENNDCIETRKKGQDWIEPLLITTTITTPLLGLAIIIILYRRYKRRLK